MDSSICDITEYVWLDHDSVGFPGSHVNSLLLFRDRVIRPSLRALDRKINALRKNNNDIDDFFAEDLAEIFQATVEGYLLTIQSMWERGVRGMLISREKKLCKGIEVAALERATWGGNRRNLQHHFTRLMGISLYSFDTYTDLDLLQSFGNAIRHGDGEAARRVYRLCPSLWWNRMEPGEVFMAGPCQISVPSDGPKHPDFASITLSETVLKQMIQSVLWFWEDIENMRCNSFRLKAPSVVQNLAAWHEARLRRESKRIWMPN